MSSRPTQVSSSRSGEIPVATSTSYATVYPPWAPKQKFGFDSAWYFPEKVPPNEIGIDRVRESRS
jgi:hypothetical protein